MDKLFSLTINTQGFQTIKKDKKTYRGFKSQKEHNQRIEEMDDDYLLRPERTEQNTYYENENLKTEEDIFNEMENIEADYKEHYKRKMPKNYKPLLNGLITFSDTFNEDIEKYGREKMTKIVAAFLKEEYGSLVSLDLHTDETTDHFHFQVINYDYNKHKTHSGLLEKSLKDPTNIHRQNYTQDRFGEYMKKHIKDFEYKRGVISSIKQYHSKRKAQQEHLNKMTEQNIKLERELKKKYEEVEELNTKYDNLNSKYKQLEAKYEAMEYELLKEFKDTIKAILEDLEELGKEEDAIKFLGLVVRYAKGNQAERLHNTISKYGKISKKVDRRLSSRGSVKQS